MTAAAAVEALEYLERLEAALEETTGRLTAAVAHLAGLSLNSVLRSELLLLSPNLGHAHRESSVPFAAVGIWAYDSDVTVVAGPLQASAPASGIGTIIVPGQRSIVWPLAGTEVTLFGTPSARVLLTLWSAPQVPSFGGTTGGSGTVDGGGA